MRIQFDIDLTDEDVSRLGTVLRDPVARDTGDRPKSIDDSLNDCAHAALREYIELFLARKVFMRIRDQREYRLLQLTAHAFNNHIPSEATVSELFQLTPAEAGSLLRSLRARYRFDMAIAIDATAKGILETLSFSKADEAYRVEIRDSTIIEHFRYMLQKEDATYSPPRKKEHTSGVWLFSREAANSLRRTYGLSMLIKDDER